MWGHCVVYHTTVLRYRLVWKSFFTNTQPPTHTHTHTHAHISITSSHSYLWIDGWMDECIHIDVEWNVCTFHTCHPNETMKKKRISLAMIETDITHSMRRYHGDVGFYLCITSSPFIHIRHIHSILYNIQYIIFSF